MRIVISGAQSFWQTGTRQNVCFQRRILGYRLRLVSSTFWIVKILVQSHFELVSLLLALEATEPVSEPVPQTALKQSSHFSTAKEISVKATFFLV